MTVNSKEEKTLLRLLSQLPNNVRELGLPEQKRYDAAECGPAQGALAAAGRLPLPGTAGGGKRRLGARRLYPSPQYQHSKGKWAPYRFECVTLEFESLKPIEKRSNDFRPFFCCWFSLLTLYFYRFRF